MRGSKSPSLQLSRSNKRPASYKAARDGFISIFEEISAREREKEEKGVNERFAESERGREKFRKGAGRRRDLETDVFVEGGSAFVIGREKNGTKSCKMGLGVSLCGGEKEVDREMVLL